MTITAQPISAARWWQHDTRNCHWMLGFPAVCSGRRLCVEGLAVLPTAPVPVRARISSTDSQNPPHYFVSRNTDTYAAFHRGLRT
jgi:hypothetical protein